MKYVIFQFFILPPLVWLIEFNGHPHCHANNLQYWNACSAAVHVGERGSEFLIGGFVSIDNTLPQFSKQLAPLSLSCAYPLPLLPLPSNLLLPLPPPPPYCNLTISCSSLSLSLSLSCNSPIFKLCLKV